jgi:hypothetical protein
LQELREMNRLIALILGLMVGMTILGIPSIRSLSDAANPFGDFAAFYTAARIDWNTLYDLNRQYEVQLEFAPAPVERMAFYFYPPFFAAFLSPLARLTYAHAFVAFTVLSLSFLGFALRTLIRHLQLDRSQARWLMFTTLINFGVYFCLLKGQTSCISLSLLVLYVVAVRNCAKNPANEYYAGVWAALLCFKPPLAIGPIAVLCVKRKWKALIAFALTMAGLGTISLAMVGWSGIRAYLEIAQRVGSGVSMDYAHNHHNLRAIVYFLAVPPVRDAIWLGATLLLFALIVVYARQPSANPRAWAVIFLIALLAAPYLHFYDLTLLIIPAAFLIKWAEDLSAPIALGLIGLDALFIVHALTDMTALTSVPLLALLLWLVFSSD